MSFADALLIAVPAALIVSTIAVVLHRLARAEKVSDNFADDLVRWYNDPDSLSDAKRAQLEAMGLPAVNDSPPPPEPGLWHCEYDDPNLQFRALTWTRDGALVQLETASDITKVEAQCWSMHEAAPLEVGYLDDAAAATLIAWRNYVWVPSHRLPAHDDTFHLSACGFVHDDDSADAFLLTTIAPNTQRTGVPPYPAFAWFELIERLLPSAMHADAQRQLATYFETPTLLDRWPARRAKYPHTPLSDSELAVVGALQSHVVHLAALLSVLADAALQIEDATAINALLSAFDAQWMRATPADARIERWRAEETARH